MYKIKEERTKELVVGICEAFLTFVLLISLFLVNVYPGSPFNALSMIMNPIVYVRDIFKFVGYFVPIITVALVAGGSIDCFVKFGKKRDVQFTYKMAKKEESKGVEVAIYIILFAIDIFAPLLVMFIIQIYAGAHFSLIYNVFCILGIVFVRLVEDVSKLIVRIKIVSKAKEIIAEENRKKEKNIRENNMPKEVVVEKKC